MSRGVLFLCVANSARSQMAEGLARRIAPGTEIFSAGSEPGTLNPYAVEVMAEIGIDIADHVSKPIDAVPKARVGTVITLCAEEVCPPYFGEATRLHWPFPDPAAAQGDAETLRARFREVRDLIAARLEAYFAG